MRRWMLALALALMPVPTVAGAAELSISRSTTVVSDLLGLLRPRALPGSVIDCALLVTNPLANLLLPVRGEQIEDGIAPGIAMRVSDLAAPNGGPVEFMDGGLLGLGLTSSGLEYRYAGLASATDGIDFSDGTRWTYVPVPDAAGYDARVRGIRIRLTGAHALAGSYRLRYRARIL